MAAEKPLWWQPVMSSFKPLVDPVSPLLWEMFRDAIAGAVRVEILPWDMTDNQARIAVGTFLMVIVEELQKPLAERSAEALIEKLKKVELL